MKIVWAGFSHDSDRNAPIWQRKLAMSDYVDGSLIWRLNVLNTQQGQHILGFLARQQTKYYDRPAY